MLEKLDSGRGHRGCRRQTALVAMLLASTLGCHAPQTARHPMRGLPRPPKAPPFEGSIAGERRVLLDQLHQMAQQDALAVQR